MKFFMAMLAVFLARVNPASTSAKPACIRNTRAPARITHTPSIALTSVAVSGSPSAPSADAASGPIRAATTMDPINRRLLVNGPSSLMADD